MLTQAGQQKEDEIKNIDPDLSKEDQAQAKDDINEKFKNQQLTKEKEYSESDKKVAAILASAAGEEEIKAKLAEIDN